jgi:hypothetical protein
VPRRSGPRHVPDAVDPCTLSKKGSLVITGFRTIDILVRHGASFAVIKDCITT